MNKEEVIKKLEEVTGLESEKCTIVNSVLENHFIIGKNNKEKMILDICEKLNETYEEAEKIYELAMSVIGSGIKDKLKHPFKSQD